MKLKIPPQPNRVQIRVAEIDYGNRRYKAVKGKFKSVTLFETNVEEVWAIIEPAIRNACKEGK